MGKINKGKSINFNGITVFIIAFAVMAIVYSMMAFGMHIGFAIACLPVAILVLLSVVKNPYIGFVLLFVLNYFIIPIMNYAGVEGLSLVMDTLIVFVLVIVGVNRIFIANPDGVNKFKPFNGLLIASLVWVVYCSLEMLNPSAMFESWFLSRGLVFYMFLVSLLTFLLIDNFKKVDSYMMILSVLTLVGALKGLMQLYVGFDPVEKVLLETVLRKTHLLPTGLRYFSIFVSAGIFGAVMGQAFVIFFIASIYTKSVPKRVYYMIVSLLAAYAMLISGTRGALAVPAAGFFLFILLSGKLKFIIPSTALFIGAYVFLAMTTIGQGNQFIRRARTAFDPKEPSLMVRLENQRLLGNYLKDKPFGEGLGLSGVENQSVSYRFTTTVATDSWYVKIWVETGIIGLLLHIAILVYVILHCCYILWFKIKDQQIKGVLTGLLCGAVGILASSYGNAVLGQYPVAIIVYSSFAIVFMGQYLDSKFRNELGLYSNNGK